MYFGTLPQFFLPDNTRFSPLFLCGYMEFFSSSSSNIAIHYDMAKTPLIEFQNQKERTQTKLTNAKKKNCLGNELFF